MRVHIHIILVPLWGIYPYPATHFSAPSGRFFGCFCSGSQETDRTGRLRIFQEGRPGRKRFPFQLLLNKAIFNRCRVGFYFDFLLNPLISHFGMA